MTPRRRLWAVATGVGLATAGIILWASRGAGQQGRVFVRARRLVGPVSEVPITQNDLLWLGRALIGEVSSRSSDWEQESTLRGGAAVVWTLAQNLMLIPGPGGAPPPRFSGLAQVATAYCQPISPAWRDMSSSGCQRSPSRCTQEQLERRARIRNTSWGALPAGVRSLLAAFADGQLPNPVPGAVDWHADHYTGASEEIAGNWFGVGTSRVLV